METKLPLRHRHICPSANRCAHARASIRLFAKLAAHMRMQPHHTQRSAHAVRTGNPATACMHACRGQRGFVCDSQHLSRVHLSTQDSRCGPSQVLATFSVDDIVAIMCLAYHMYISYRTAQERACDGRPALHLLPAFHPTPSTRCSSRKCIWDLHLAKLHARPRVKMRAAHAVASAPLPQSA
jgi:hypothetical protein